jgi:hypothetical protein
VGQRAGRRTSKDIAGALGSDGRTIRSYFFRLFYPLEGRMSRRHLRRPFLPERRHSGTPGPPARARDDTLERSLVQHLLVPVPLMSVYHVLLFLHSFSGYDAS